MTPGAQGSGSMSPGAGGSGSSAPGMQGSGSMSPGAGGSGSSAPGMQGSGSYSPGMQGSGSSAPGMQGSGSTDSSGGDAGSGSASMAPGMQGSGMQGSGSYNPAGPHPDAGSAGAAMDSSAYQQQMSNSAQGSQPQGSGSQGSGSQGSGSSAGYAPGGSMPGYGPGGSMPAGSSSGGGYNPNGGMPGGSTSSPANYSGQMSPQAGPQGGTAGSSDVPTPYGGEGQAGGDSSTPGTGMAPGQQPVKPVTLVDIAQLSFRYGHDQDALLSLYGHGVITDVEEAKEVLDKMGWVPDLKHPALTVRWGIAIEYVAPRGYTGSVYPVGTTQNLQVKSAAGGGGGGGGAPAMGMGEGGMGQPGAGGAQGSAQLQQLTGELGQKVVAQLQERVARGDFGQVLAAAGQAPAAGAGGMGAGGGMSGYGMPQGGSEMSGAPAGPGQLGGPGMGAGYGGAAGSGMGAGGPAPGGPAAGGAVSLSPGIVMLGIVNAKDLREKARKAGVDAVCVFNVLVTVNPRLGTIKNETTIRVHDLEQTRELYESKALNNIAIQIERVEKKEDQDPVDKAMEALFKYVDENWKMGPLPAALQADNVLNRLRTLLAQTHENPLPVLAEARMYQTRGLLQDNHYLTACQKLVGEAEGTTLATGSRVAKLVVIGKWLPQPPK